MGQVTGKVFVAVGGVRMRSKEGATLDTGGASRDAAMSDSGVDGYVETNTPPTVEFAINHTAQTSLTELQQMTDVTLTFETDTGRIYTVINAWCARPPKLAKGEVSLQFQGVECIEG